MPARPRPVARRTTLAGALVGLGIVTGCDLDLPGDGASAGGPGPSQDPDTELVAQAVTELGSLLGLVSAAATEFPRLAVPTAALRRLHDAHLTALGAGPGRAVAFGGRITVPAQALGTIRTRERRLQGRLTDLAVAAQSGALARLLASMSAAVGQVLTELPTSLPAATVPR